MTLRRLHGEALKHAIVMNTFLPDHPKMFRKNAVKLALAEEGYECARTTLDQVLAKLVMQGYMERAADPGEQDAAKRVFWYRFVRIDRTSDRPGFGPGEQHDVMSWKEDAENE